MLALARPLIQRQVQRAEQRDDHDRGIDQHRGGQEHGDMPAHRLCGRPWRLPHSLPGNILGGCGGQTAPRASAPSAGRLDCITAAACTSSPGPPAASLGAGLRRLGAVDHLGRGVPGLVLQVRRAARQDLVGRADRRLAVLAPADEFLRQRVAPSRPASSSARRSPAARWRRAPRIRASRPSRGRSSPLRHARSCAFMPMRDVGMVRDVAGVARLLHRRREGAHLEARPGR